MKKTLLMTTALVAVFSAANVYAEDWTINSKETITNEFISRDNVTVATGGDITISGNNSGIISNSNFTMEDGSLTASSNGGSADTGVFVKGNGADVNIQGGDVNLTDSRIYKGNDIATTGNINISGGNITLNKNAYIEMRKENTGNVNMTSGKLVMNENSGLLLNTNDDQVVDGNVIKFIINGDDATITANGNNQISGDIDFTKGTITVANGATLTSGDIAMKSENAIIDLLGKLDTNVNGTGHLCFKNSAANVSGNVTGSNLTFEADHSLSKAISGTIGDLTAMNVNNGTLTYDKQTGKIGELSTAR